MKLYKTKKGVVLATDGEHRLLPGADWDELINRADLRRDLEEAWAVGESVSVTDALEGEQLLAPIGRQEVWAAGVTYYRSRTARIEEAKSAGGGDFYDRVYTAERPELFLKATPHRVAAPFAGVRLRRDSHWNVPEPELALLVNSAGQIIGYTAANDMSSRDIEGENPLYLPQAKVWDKSCALGPGVLVADEALPAATAIELQIKRAGEIIFAGATTLEQLKRTPASLVEYLFRDNSFPDGCYLLTGTGIVPPDEFTLEPGDEISITIAPIGTLVNRVTTGVTSNE